MQAAPDIDYITDRFRLFDRNGDGRIDADELGIVLSSLDQRWTKARLARLFAVLDVDSSGSIEYQEFVTWAFGLKGVQTKDINDFRGAVQGRAMGSKKFRRRVAAQDANLPQHSVMVTGFELSLQDRPQEADREAAQLQLMRPHTSQDTRATGGDERCPGSEESLEEQERRRREAQAREEQERRRREAQAAPAEEAAAAAAEEDAERERCRSEEAPTLLSWLAEDGQTLEYAPDELRADEAFVLKAVRQNGWQLLDAAEELKGNHRIVFAAVRSQGTALEYASQELRGSERVVLAAVQQDGMALRSAATALRGQEDVAIAAVRQNGRALQFCAPDMRKSHHIVLAAVQQDGLALQWASDDLRREEEIVLAAVSRDGERALEHVAEGVQAQVRQAAEARHLSVQEYARAELAEVDA